MKFRRRWPRFRCCYEYCTFIAAVVAVVKVCCAPLVVVKMKQGVFAVDCVVIVMVEIVMLVVLAVLAAPCACVRAPLRPLRYPL